LRRYVNEQSAVLAVTSLTPLQGSGHQVFAPKKGGNYISFFFLFPVLFHYSDFKFWELGASRYIFYNPYHRNYSILAFSLCLISVNDHDGNRAEGASAVRGNKHYGVKQLLYILIKIDLIRYKSFYLIQVLIQFFVRRSERTLKTGNVFRQKSGVLFNLKE